MLLASACIVFGSAAWAQQSQKPAASSPISTDLGVTFSLERSQVVPQVCCFWFKGGGADAAVTFWKGLGIAASLTGDHKANAEPGADINKIAYMAGPRYTFNLWSGHAAPPDPRRLQFFAQGLFGGSHGFNSVFPASGGATSSANSFAIQAGGGFNYYFTQHWGLRFIEADYVRTAFPNVGEDIQNDLRLSFGATYHFQAAPPLPAVTLACAVNPTSIFPGDPVTVTATAGNLLPKLNAIYSWSGPGVTGSGTTATVATGSLAAGQYNIQATVKEGKPGKEGLRPWETATCTAGLTVKAFEPPTISCSVSPSTIKPGDTATVTSVGMSPQNRPLTYSYAASAGTVTGSGTTATYSSAGAPTGAVGITCNVSDDKGQSATSSTNLTITAPYVPPQPHTQALCSISFATDKKRPMRVDNEAKACLDQVALDLKQQADAKAVIVGEQNSDEAAKEAKQQKYAMHHKHATVDQFAAQRAVNAKDYLVTDQGIDASRITIMTGTANDQTAQDYLVPTGANFAQDVQGGTPVDETAVKPEPRKPLPMRQGKK
jgi:hypothetical protein